ncbi:PREDICTED: seed biotin-containing protein SBP65 [Nelumbo nucifera]|uniref:Seed biotin-containing protein SBP65-like n=2 Tax=Nelumbo nucifera TaxID=4432 RepID=A0A822XUP4_NELNU|nr:PREDICTED: seed biotin-containing protein SBP65 [Nelumbo nucifera]DAD21168.1 TPA_asm: hypothetical protein HUJ06_022631 [Nelumbo nucifera]
MASEQAIRSDLITADRDEVHVEKERVPKMTQHFESLAEKVREPDLGNYDSHSGKVNQAEARFKEGREPFGIAKVGHHGGPLQQSNTGNVDVVAEQGRESQGVAGTTKNEVHSGQGSLTGRVDVGGIKPIGKMESVGKERDSKLAGTRDTQSDEWKESRFSAAEEARGEKQRASSITGDKGGRSEKEQPTAQDMGNYQTIAQQASAEAIRRRAEKLNEKAKELVAMTRQQGVQREAEHGTEKGSITGVTRPEEDQRGYYDDNNKEKSQAQQQGYVGAKDTIAGIGKTAMDYTLQAAAQAKDTTVNVGKSIASSVGEKNAENKDTATQRVQRETTSGPEKSRTTNELTGPEGGQQGHEVHDNNKEKSQQQGYVAAKDTIAGAGKTAMDYSLQVATRAKDTAANVGKSVASYMGEKNAENKERKTESGPEKGPTNEVTSPEEGQQGNDNTTEKSQQVYAAAKDTIAGASKNAMDYTLQGAAKAKDTAVSNGKNIANYVGEKNAENKDASAQRVQRGAQSGEGQQDHDNNEEKSQQGSVAAKDIIAGASKTAMDHTQQAAAIAKDTAVGVSNNIASYVGQMNTGNEDTTTQNVQREDESRPEKGPTSEVTGPEEEGQQGNDNIKDKSQQSYVGAKNTVAAAGKTAMDYTLQAAVKAKDTALIISNSIASYAGEKAAVAKDVTLENSKKVGGLAGQKTVEAKDTAVDTAGRVSKSIASYTGEKAAVAKDVTLESSKKVGGLAGQKAVEAKDAAAKTGWAAARYASEKAALAANAAALYTAKKEIEANQPSETREKFAAMAEGKGGEDQDIATKFKETVGIQSGPTEETKQEEDEGGLLSAVGETVVEIAQCAKDLVIGQEPGDETKHE